MAASPFQAQYFFEPRKHLRPTACSEKLNEPVADEFSVVERAQIADKPVPPVPKAVTEKTVSIDEIAAGVFNKASPRTDADVVPLAQYDRLDVELFFRVVKAFYIRTTVKHCNRVRRDRFHHAERSV